MNNNNLSPEVRAELKALIAEAVEETLTRLGVQTNDPIEAQKDFQHLRDWRLLTQSLKMKAVVSIFGLAVTGSAAAFWLGIKEYITK